VVGPPPPPSWGEGEVAFNLGCVGAGSTTQDSQRSLSSTPCQARGRSEPLCCLHSATRSGRSNTHPVPIQCNCDILSLFFFVEITSCGNIFRVESSNPPGFTERPGLAWSHGGGLWRRGVRAAVAAKKCLAPAPLCPGLWPNETAATSITPRHLCFFFGGEAAKKLRPVPPNCTPSLQSSPVISLPTRKGLFIGGVHGNYF